VDAHLFFDLADDDRVARAQLPSSFDQELRHDEERDALGALAAFDALASTRWMMFSDMS
jgi:hypothetical protein